MTEVASSGATTGLPGGPKPPLTRKCIGVDCEKDAGALQCPTCLKLGKESFFCGQDCFKRSWVSELPFLEAIFKKPITNLLQSQHKTIHKTNGKNLLRGILAPSVISEPDPATGHYNPFPTFPYTGTIRPVYPLSPRRPVPESIQHPDYAKDGIPRSEQRFIGKRNITILDEKGQAGMRKVCRLAREVLDIAAREARPGVTTDYIDEVVHRACLEREVGATKEPAYAPLIVSVIPVPAELRSIPKVRVHVGQRGHLPWHSGPAEA